MEFAGKEFQYVYEWGDGATDTEIWDYALKNNLVIITRDSDFYFRLLISKVNPKVIYLKLQQLNKNGFKEFISNNWGDINSLIFKVDMVIVDLENIQMISK